MVQYSEKHQAGSNTDPSAVRNGYLYDEESTQIAGAGARSGFLTAKANTPVLTQGMIPIKYNPTTTSWTICSTTDPDWYSYTARGKKWANIMLSDGAYNSNNAVVGTEVAENDLGSMFVWVPRYAYSIVNGYKTSNNEEVWTTNAKIQKNIKIQYLVGTTNTDVEGTGYNTDYDANSIAAGEVTPMITHPTFTSQTNYITGQPTQLPGVWIAKFEASGTDSNGIAVGNYTNGGEAVQATDESTIVKSLPSKISWRHIQIGEMQYRATQMSAKTDYGWSAGTVDTHLIKNSEWGSAAYLCYSRYGITPMINGCGTTSPRWYDLYTGMGPSATTSEGRYNASARSGHEYNTANGKLASTTGNTYGIYDMSGGAWEYVASYLDNKADNLYTYGKSTSNSSVIYFPNGTKELDSQYAALWEAYQVSSEERNDQITVEGVEGTLTKNQLWNAIGSSYASTSVQYNTARKRITDATFNLMASKKGIGVNEVADSHSFYGVDSNGGLAWRQNATDTGGNYGKAWNQDYMLIGHAAYLFVAHGGSIQDGVNAGVLYSYAYKGVNYINFGFRVAILPEESYSTNINIAPGSGTIILGNGNLTPSVYVTAEAGALSAVSSDNAIATASLSAVSNGTATLTVTPHAVGTATITVTESNGNQTATYRVTVQTANYQVASTGKYYNTLAMAYTAAPSGDTINVLQDCIDEAPLSITKEITLNLGAHTITRNSGITSIFDGGTLNINGSIANGTPGTFISTGANAINVIGGTLNLNSGNLSGSTNYAINQTGGTVNIGRQADAFVDADTTPADTLAVLGANYGIYSTGGNWNLYNGYVKGSVQGANTDASAVRNGYLYDTDSGSNQSISFLTAKANAPTLTQGMIPIKWNPEGANGVGIWVICSTNDPEWFSYTARERKWANVMLCDGTYNSSNAVVGTEVAEADLGSMFVWVPRYAYSIQRGYKGKDTDGITDISTMTEHPWETNAKLQKNIKVQYMNGITNSDIEGISYGTDYNINDYEAGAITPMIVHPTFTSQKDKSGNTLQLPGVWVSKFEASKSNSNIVASLPNKSSWRNIKIGEMQYQSASMSSNTTYGWTADTINTHLIKNSEWGSVAYMCYSRYGTVPMINGYSNYVTGLGPKSSNSESSYTTSSSGHEYNTTNGELASTSGNTYGIYDMSGGSYEYVASFVDNGHSNLSSNGNPTSNSSVKYFNDNVFNTDYVDLWEVYETSLLDNSIIWNAGGGEENNRIRRQMTNEIVSKLPKGIGISETASEWSYFGVLSTGNYNWIQQNELNSSSGTYNITWNYDANAMVSSYLFINRGYYSPQGSKAGILSSTGNNGGAGGVFGFRPAILPEEGASTNINITPSTGVVVLGNGNLTTNVYVTSEAGSLSASSSDNAIATASLSAVSNGTATLTVTPQAVGTATITVTEATGGQTATYRVTVQAPNYQVASTGKYYNTLATAYAGAPAGGTINVLQDSIDEAPVSVAKEVTLNLGAHTITRNSGITSIVDGGTLNINGSIANGTPGTFISTGANAINVIGGTLNLNSGNLSGSTNYAINQTGGTVNIGRQADAFVDADTTLADTLAVLGANYGIYSTGGNWNLYNGYVKGSVQGANTDASAVRNGYLYDTDSGSNTSISNQSISFLTAKANAPVLTQGMIPIKWNPEGANGEGAWTICSSTDPEWYSYTARNKQWANIMLSDGTYNKDTPVGTEVGEADLGSMFVWVPRYAYSIQRGYKGKDTDGITDISTMTEDPRETNAKLQKNIKVQYMNGITNSDIEGISYGTDYNINDYEAGAITPMIVHPTFTSQKDKSGNILQLPGVWVSKFEASQSNSNTVASLPNKSNWRNIKIGEMQYQSASMSSNTTYGWTANTINTHLIKNSEWKSVAYMCYSRYGTAPTTNGYTGYVTGMGVINKYNENTYGNNIDFKEHRYTGTNGKLSSTTGNTYGIYDMSGGAWELTSSFINNGHDNLSENGNPTSTSSVKYFNNNVLNTDYDYLWEVYETSSLDNSTIWNAGGGEENNRIRQQITNEIVFKLPKGIGVSETASEWSYLGVLSTGSYGWMKENNYNASSGEVAITWNGDVNLVGSDSNIFVASGGCAGNGVSAGVLAVCGIGGEGRKQDGFRPAILPEEGASTNINITPSTGVVVLGNGNLTTSVYVTAEAGALSLSSSDTNIATASLSAVSNGTATLTVTPHAVGSATITVTEATGGQTATYRVTVQAPNYQVASTGTYYNTLATAYAGAPAGGTINALQDATDTSSVMVAKDITLNLGTHTISRGNAEINVASGGTLTIYDGNINATANSAITQTGGTVNIGRQADAFVDVDTLLGTGPFRSVRELLPEEPELQVQTTVFTQLAETGTYTMEQSSEEPPQEATLIHRLYVMDMCTMQMQLHLQFQA